LLQKKKKTRDKFRANPGISYDAVLTSIAGLKPG